MRKKVSLIIVGMLIFSGFAGLMFFASDAVNADGIANSPWPCYMGDTKHTGLSPYDTSHLDGTLKWGIRNGFVDSSRPVIDGNGRIIFSCGNGSVNAMSREGNLIWSYSINSFVVSYPAIDSNGNIYVSAGDDQMHAISPDGTLKWTFPIDDYSNPPPTIGSDGTIYVGSKGLYALNPDGSLLWNFSANGTIYTPALGDDGTLYCGSSDDYVFAINPDGSLKWKYNANETTVTASIGKDGTIYVGSRNNMTALNPDGSLKWQTNIGGTTPAIGKDGTLYFGSHNYTFWALTPDGKPKWSYFTGDDGPSGWSHPAIGSDGTIYVGSDDHNFYSFTPTGKVKWSFLTGGMVTGSPAIDEDGTIYFGAWDGHLYALGSNGHFLPSNPRNLTTHIGINENTISWQAPESDGGSPIIGYRIYREDHLVMEHGTTYSIVKPLATVGNVTTYTDTTVVEGGEYTYHVTAINSIGEGHTYFVGVGKPATDSHISPIYVIILVVVAIAGAALFLRMRGKHDISEASPDSEEPEPVDE